jgi:NAD(P)-dependent dehydrogenase (short-subunit alcohol dehydrogenase family)
MDVANLAGKTALVTGAGSGIGRASALAFAERGADLVICDVSKEGLEGTAGRIQSLGRRVTSHQVDVADAEQMAEFAAAVHADLPAVDLLMNNAGVAIGGGFLDTSLADWEWILGVNLRGVIHGCHHFVPNMVERGAGGHVINVASAAGYTASAELAAYCTTKFAVVGLSESLRDELAPHRIGVTAICPGLINTPITRAAKMVGRDITPEMREEMIRVYERRGYTPERVARNILKAVAKNRAVAPIAAEAWIMYYGKRLFPGLLARLARRARDRRRRSTGLTAGGG